MANNNITQPTTSEVEFPEELKARGREFFRKGSEVAYALNYDYAIELFLDGISFWPDALEEGHKPLREIALRRQGGGGKKSGFTDKSKFRKMSDKSPKDTMLKGEYLLCKDPTHLGHLSDALKGAIDAGFKATALWMANWLFDANRQQAKPSHATYIFLKDCYVKLEIFNMALQCCAQALQLKPNDMDLQQVMRDLSAQNTMQQGKYDEDGDFRDSIKDRENQEKLQSQELLIHSDETKSDLIATARKEYLENPTVPGKVYKLVDTLCETEDEDNENEAVQILEKAFAQANQFRYKQRSGNIKIKQLKRNKRILQDALESVGGQDEELENDIKEIGNQVLDAELAHYKLCMENYPTDLGIKQEYGIRLLQAEKFDDAIPIFQEARNDARYRVAALNSIGQCFFRKQWYADAVETYEQALEVVENKESELAKDVRYNLGSACEADGRPDEALDHFRIIAQIDFNYRDVRDRIDTLRKQQRNKE